MTDGSSGITLDYSAEAREQYWELYLKVVSMEVASGKSKLGFLSFADIESKHPRLLSWIANSNLWSQVGRLSVWSSFRAVSHSRKLPISLLTFACQHPSVCNYEELS